MLHPWPPVDESTGPRMMNNAPQPDPIQPPRNMRTEAPASPESFRTRFRKNLLYWTLHCSLNALPSFSIALFFVGLVKSPPAIAVMCCAIATFVLLYALLTSIDSSLARRDHLLARAMRVGTMIRAWLSGLSLIPILTNSPQFSPDAWCGFAALWLLEQGSRSLRFRTPNWSGTEDVGNLWWVYSATMLEGFILSLFLFTFAFFALVVLQARARRQLFLNPDPRHEGGI